MANIVFIFLVELVLFDLPSHEGLAPECNGFIDGEAQNLGTHAQSALECAA